MIEIIIYFALYLLIFAFDIVPLIKSKRKKSLTIYLPVFFLTLVINILFSLGVKIPSPAIPVKDVVSRIFGVK